MHISKMDQENIMFFKNQDESHTMIDLYLYDRFFGQKDSYGYCDIDVDKILLFKKSNNEYIIRYNDVYYTKIISLQLEINNFYSEIRTYANNNRVMYIHGDDRKTFVKTALDDGNEYIEVDVNKNTSLVRGNPKDLKELVIVLDSIISDCLETSLV